MTGRWQRLLLVLLAAPGALVGLATVYDQLATPHLPTPTLPVQPGQGIDGLLRAAQAASGAPAIGVAWVSASGVTAIRVAGTRERGGRVAVGTDDPWHLGSDGKTMVAVVYARLVEQGRAHGGATIPELFPNLARRIDLAWRTITIDDLLTHRAGVSDEGLRFRLLGIWFDARPLDVQRRPFPAQRRSDAASSSSERPV